MSEKKYNKNSLQGTVYVLLSAIVSVWAEC